MNHRERVCTALNHREPDRVPLDINGTTCTSLTKIAYENLREFLKLAVDENPQVSSRIMGSVRAKEDLLLHYGTDTRPVSLRPPRVSKLREMPDNSYYDDFNIRWRQASYYYDAVERPLAAATLTDLDGAAWPDPSDKGYVDGLRDEAKRLYETTPYCLVADIPANGPFEGCCLTRGYDQFCMDLYLDPKFAEALLDKMTETAIAFWDIFLSEVGDYVQVCANGDDVAMQSGPFVSPAMYRRFIKPCHKRIFDFIHSKTNAKVFYHSCGSVLDLIPDFIEEGVDALNPVQRSAAQMDIDRLKREYGKDICFWGGGIDIQRQLPVLTPAQIEEEVKRTIDVMAPGGGFVFFATHNIQPDVTPDRIDALFNAVLRHGN
jgi:uroporphyrinogen decarboxylase